LNQSDTLLYTFIFFIFIQYKKITEVLMILNRCLLFSKRYPLEAHFVHYDSSRFKSVKEAVGVEDGIAVVGVLYRVSNRVM
jgi:hypothetical protein